MDGTPVYDIKPYIPYTDCHPEAASGFAPDAGITLEVAVPDGLLKDMDPELVDTLVKVLSRDPRPSYHNEPQREYGMCFGNFDIRFTVSDGTLTVTGVSKRRA